MSRKAYNSRFKVFGRFIIMLAVFLMVLAAPAFGQIKSVRSRVLQKPQDIITTKKANFKIGDLLDPDVKLVSITVKNDSTDTAPDVLLMKMDIDFGGTWDDEFVSLSFAKKMEPGESFTFNNSDMLSYIGMIRMNDAKYSDTIIQRTGSLLQKS